MYLFIPTCPRAFSVHFLQASTIAKLSCKVFFFNLSKNYYTKNLKLKMYWIWFLFCQKKSIKLATLPPMMSKDFFKKYNISDSKGL